MTINLDIYKYYQILGCTSRSSYQDLKQAYKQMALLHHPDKNAKSKQYEHDTFLKIKEAWRILSNPELKKIYDAECRQAELESENILVYDRIHISDMKTEATIALTYPCRCGSNYVIDKNELTIFNDLIYITCEECTFALIVEK